MPKVNDIAFPWLFAGISPNMKRYSRTFESSVKILSTWGQSAGKHFLQENALLRDFTPSIKNKSMKLTPDWICGFVEGEGSFVISITTTPGAKNQTLFLQSPENTMVPVQSSLINNFQTPKKNLHKQVRLYFKVTQSIKNVQVLHELKKTFGVGHVKAQNVNQTVWEYTVSRFEHLQSKIIPFFEKHTLHTSKQFDFYRFRKIALYMSRGEHLTQEGIIKIEALAKRMNTKQIVEESFDEDKVRTSLREEEENKEID